MNKMYECVKPLTLKHLYTEPNEQTILPSWGKWELVRQNKSKGTINMLLHDEIMQTHINITDNVLAAHFREVGL